MDQNFDSILFFSVIISFITFFFWSRTGTQLLEYINSFRNTSSVNNSNTSTSTNTTTTYNNNTTSTTNSTTNNNSDTTTTNDHNTPLIQPLEKPSEPFQEDFTNQDVSDLVKINIIQSENVYNRTFKTSKILKVYDLKKYFYPKEIQDNKRILFIYNGRAMIDTHLLSSHLNLLNGVNGAAFIHCLIKNPLTADQVSNDPNSSSYGSNGSNTNTNNRRPTMNNGNSNNNGSNSNFNDTSFTWMCTKTLFFLTGLFLALLWCLQFLNPKLFNLFSSVLLFIFTFFWGIGFYSLKSPTPTPTTTIPPTATIPPTTQPTATSNHLHND